MMISLQWRLTHSTIILHQMFRIHVCDVSKIFDISYWKFMDPNLFLLNFMNMVYRKLNIIFNIFIFNSRWLLQIYSFNFDVPVYPKRDLLFIPIILICDMICVLWYLTDGRSIMVVEIVDQSFCINECRWV